MDRKAPAIPVRIPLRQSAIYLIRFTGMPTDSAASGDSPTARICIPSLVYLNIYHTTATKTSAVYVRT